MYLSRLVMNPLSREVRRDAADCQHLHRTVMGAFPEHGSNARAHFGVLHRLEENQATGGMTLLVQSGVAPDWSHLPARYALSLSCKEISGAYESISNGTRLRFRLLGNVTKKVKSDGPNGRRVALNTDQDRLTWLLRHAEAGGFELLEVMSGAGVLDVLSHAVGGGRVHGRHAAGRLSFGAVLFEGRLRVVDAERFRGTLRSGVGSAKAYGFGLLSVAPA